MRYLSVIQDALSMEADSAERLALLNRVATSRQLRRATRLRDFLLYVGKQSIEHHVESIREQEIGEVVFGRQPDYDTSLDNIVRVNATELRKRLDQYFEEEGAAEELIVSIPRGSYTPQFSRRVVSSTAAFHEVPDTPDEPASSSLIESVPPAEAETSPGHMRWIMAGMVGVIAVLLVSLLWQRSLYRAAMEPWHSDAALTRFWAPFFGSPDEVDLVLADTSLAMAKDISGKPVSLESYIHFQYRQPSSWTGLSADRQADLAQVLNRGNVSLGDVHVAQQILSLSPYNKTLKLYSAREFNSESIRQNHVILIGSRESNPWVDLFKEQMNFSVEYETSPHRPYVTNRTPLTGEQSVYEAPLDPTREHGYAVIAFLRSIRADHVALIICGTDAQATRAAGEFVTNPILLNTLLEKLPAGKVVPFEVLLRTTQLTGTPMRSELVAMRIHQP